MGWKLKHPPRLGDERETKSDTKTKKIRGSRQHGQGTSWKSFLRKVSAYGEKDVLAKRKRTDSDERMTRVQWDQHQC